MKRMAYSLYKRAYSEFPCHDYDPAKKTVAVELPTYTKPAFPDSWAKSQVLGYYKTPNGYRVYTYSTGLYESYRVEWEDGVIRHHREFGPGLYARQEVIDFIG